MPLLEHIPVQGYSRKRHIMAARLWSRRRGSAAAYGAEL